MSVHAPAGWYTDPTGAAPLRWWDGQQWTASTSAAPFATAAVTDAVVGAAPAYAPSQPTYPAVVPTEAAPSQLVPAQYQPQPYQAPYQQPRPAVGWERNRYAFYTLGIVAIYIVVAIASNIVFIGILPLLMSFRSHKANEQLAPLAIGAAVVALVIAFVSMSGH